MAPWPFGSSPPTPQSQSSPEGHRPEATPPSSPSRRHDSDLDNPFIAFRRAVDDQFRTLATSFSMLPALLNELQQRGGDLPRQSATDPWSGLPAGDDEDHVQRATVAAAQALLYQARTACARNSITPNAILSLYRDPESHSDPFSSFPLFDLHPQPHWLSTHWFRDSPYSPTRLEVHRHAHQHGSMWRAAFEDLLSTSLDSPAAGDAHAAFTDRRRDQERYNAWAQRPVDWMLGLQCRGILPPQLPRLYQLGSKAEMDASWGRVVADVHAPLLDPADLGVAQDVQDLAYEIVEDEYSQADEAEMRDPNEQSRPAKDESKERAEAWHAQEKERTELDAYEALLGYDGRRARRDRKQGHGETPSRQERRSETAPARAQDVQQIDAPKEKTGTPRPGILSTLSTTERTTLPDGTVTTKTLLKRRFADGREESVETVTTTSHAGHPVEQGGQDSPSQPQGSEAGGTSGHGKGWFWG